MNFTLYKHSTQHKILQNLNNILHILNIPSLIQNFDRSIIEQAVCATFVSLMHS